MAFSFGKPPSSTPSFGTTPLFGAQSTGTATAPQQTAPSTSLFGQKPAGQGLFGAAPPSGASNSFGSMPPTNPATTLGTQQSGLFGGKTPGSSGTSGGLFGSQPQSSGGLSQNQPQQGGLFGSQSQQGSSTIGSQPQKGAGLFGSQPQQGASLFGSQPQQGAGSLGSQPQQGGLFGSQPQQGGLFGSQPQQGSLFGQTAKPGAQPTSAPQATSAVQDKKFGAPLHTQLERIASSWDTSNLSTCQFQYYLYNRAPDAQSLTQLCVRRPDAVGPMHDALWNKALQENPEPDRLYPVLAVGFGDLQIRSNAQVTEAARQTNKAAELTKKLAELRQKHDLANVVRAQSAMMMQTRIRQRLLSLTKDAGVMIPALRGQSLTASEDAVKAALENCDAQLNGALPNYASSTTPVHARLRAQLNELWAQLSIVRAKREAAQAQGRVNGGTEWVVVDESSFDEITQILGLLQQGLVHLSNTLMSDSKALDTVCEGLKGVPLVGVRHR